MIFRSQYPNIQELLFKGKAIILFGARQVGKSSLIREIVKNENFLWLNGDEADVSLLLDNITSERLKALVRNHKMLVIDEAEKVFDIGLRLERLVLTSRVNQSTGVA